MLISCKTTAENYSNLHHLFSLSLTSTIVIARNGKCSGNTMRPSLRSETVPHAWHPHPARHALSPRHCHPSLSRLVLHRSHPNLLRTKPHHLKRSRNLQPLDDPLPLRLRSPPMPQPVPPDPEHCHPHGDDFWVHGLAARPCMLGFGFRAWYGE